MREKKHIALSHVREKKPNALIHVREKKHIALIHVREKKSWHSFMGGKRVFSWMYKDSLEIMIEEELHRPSNQTDFKVEVNGQDVQVQVLVHLHFSGLSKTSHHYQFTVTV